MSQSVGTAFSVNRNIEILKDDKTYKSGDDGTLVRAKGGSVKQWFREAFNADSVKQKNQQALDNLKQQLIQQYGKDAVGDRLVLTGKLVTGKQTITGKDLKGLAKKVTDEAVRQASQAGQRIETAIKALALKPNVKPEESMQALLKELPPGMPSARKQDILLNAMSKMRHENSQMPLLAGLKNCLLGQAGTDMVKLLDSQALTSLANKMRDETTPERKELFGKLEKCMSTGKDMKMMQDALRQFLATEDGFGLGRTPELKSGSVSWLKPSPESKEMLTRLGLPNLMDYALEQLKEKVLPQQQKNTFLRGSEASLQLFSALFRSEMEPHCQNILNCMRPELLKLAPQLKTTKAVEFTASEFVTEISKDPKKIEEFNKKIKPLQEAMKQSFDSLPVKQSLQHCISTLTQSIRPTLVDMEDDTIGDQMFKTFNRTALLGGLNLALFEMRSNPSVPDAEKNLANLTSVFIQHELREGNLTHGSFWNNHFSDIQGWQDMTAPLPSILILK